MNPPEPENEEARLAALRSLGILDSSQQSVFDHITELAAAICKTPIALISLVDSNRQWFKSKVGVDFSETPKDESICAHTILTPDDVFVINDTKSDARFEGMPLVQNGTIGFYAGAPLVTPDGFPLGAVCVIDHKERQIDLNQTLMLQHLADLTMTIITNEVNRKRTAQDTLREVRESAQVIRDVLDQGRDMGAFIDKEHRYLYVNAAFERYWVHTQDEIIGMEVRDLVGAKLYNEQVQPRINQALRGQECELELTTTYPAIGKRVVEMRYIPAFDEAGNVRGVVERIRDLTVLHEKARELASLVEELNAKRLAKRKYLHTISHDLKEPVNAINNSIELLNELCPVESDIEARCRDYIARGGRRISRLLEDLRLFIQLNSSELLSEVCSAKGLIDSALSQIADEIASRAVRVRVDASGEIFVDDEIFDLALRSVLEDALRSIKGESPCISITLHRQPSRALIEVRIRADDSPPGDYTQNDFQLEEEESLGLSIAQHILSLHNGDLSVSRKSSNERVYFINLFGVNNLNDS